MMDDSSTFSSVYSFEIIKVRRTLHSDLGILIMGRTLLSFNQTVGIDPERAL